ncbi:MAG: VWA domain-containing protein, partial [Acidimicrobiales bacterium]|nr:VWA domain-containing protein [Acidimicrobiales bacterium]
MKNLIALRRPAARVVVAILLALTWIASTPTVADAQRDADLGPCAVGADLVSALFLVDESTSMSEVDPVYNRVSGIKAAIDQLAGLATETRTIAVSVAGFGHAYDSIVPFTDLTPETRADTVAAVEAIRTRAGSIDSDFALGLAGARADLAGRTGPGTCAILVVVTDSGIEIEARDDASAETFGTTKPYAPDANLTTASGAEQAATAAFEQVCRADGDLDQLRTDDVRIISAPMTATMSLDAQSFTQALANGGTCGEAAGKGSYIPAPSPAEWFNALAGFGTTVTGADVSTQTALVCQLIDCEQGRVGVEADGQIGRFSALASFQTPGIKVVITAPDGSQVELDAGATTTQVAGSVVTATWLSDTAVNVEVRPQTGSVAPGLWQLSAIDPTGTGLGNEPQVEFEISVFPPAQIEIVAVSTATPGEPFDLEVALVDGSGAPMPEDAFSSVALAAALIDDQTGDSVLVELSPTETGTYRSSGAAIPSAFSRTSELTVSAQTVTADGTSARTQLRRSLSADSAGVTPPTPTEPTDPNAESDEGFFSFLPSFSTPSWLPWAVIGLAGLILLGWAVRRWSSARSATFALEGVQAAEIGVVIRSNGQIDRAEPDGTTRQLYLRGTDFSPVGSAESDSFATDRARYSTVDRSTALAFGAG